MFTFQPESHTTRLFPELEDVGHEDLVLSFLSSLRLGGLGGEAVGVGGGFCGLAAAGQSVTGSSSGSVLGFF